MSSARALFEQAIRALRRAQEVDGAERHVLLDEAVRLHRLAVQAMSPDLFGPDPAPPRRAR